MLASPADALYDEPISIRLAGLPASTQVVVRADAIDDLGHRWASYAEFVTDSTGAIDLARTAPIADSYSLADANGLLWSMTLDSAIVERTPFVKINAEPVSIKLSAATDGKIVDQAELTRRFLAPGIVQKQVSDDGLVATMFHHEDGPRSGVILLGGSGGGLSVEHPAMLASRGFAVMSLGYFAMPGLPRDLMDIPLEYFAKAIAWMRNHLSVRGDKIAAIGSSRGGELVLLLGATFPEIKAVVAYVPSGIVWPGIGAAGAPVRSAWTLKGEQVPCIATTTDGLEAWQQSPVALTPWFLECLKHRQSAERAAIAVEKISGPVLMFSGTDDQMWPSLNLADIAMQRLNALNFPHPHEHVAYAGAGHLIRFPYTPVITEIFHPVVKTPMALGGTPAANHLANLDSWRRCLRFLATHLD
ncbi:MAG: acyl-CoA thioesterase/bile acid-CoA:amino acid N-acyltransferase family protein [Candidatus Binatus sp.]|uniref:acyl-CoA thioesterase/bile acid-CoA:amino acid N-acyltransferase family protein n=1 Tax=Candidatus Binatus sp. TaxID=2811406 RepID=UPI00271917D9|nr:acyl-CoA thioesterase/bile acid-CoA:amino acid N-acyltransferase family protein [Candidatus Binatus sp.]MDO8434177.1 acyl-CoA thioesterase/bile acid-CoA:amino acid N-acyltransferase family protein [Candidatus Binatus sp.]